MLSSDPLLTTRLIDDMLFFIDVFQGGREDGLASYPLQEALGYPTDLLIPYIYHRNTNAC